MPKAHEYRVSLTLNRNDPLHRTAISALEGQGRRKTQYVVNAITSYIIPCLQQTGSPIRLYNSA